MTDLPSMTSSISQSSLSSTAVSTTATTAGHVIAESLLAADPSTLGARPAEQDRAALVQAERDAWKNSNARNKLKKQIDELPRTGSLLTLDVKGNDIKASSLSRLLFVSCPYSHSIVGVQ